MSTEENGDIFLQIIDNLKYGPQATTFTGVHLQSLQLQIISLPWNKAVTSG